MRIRNSENIDLNLDDNDANEKDDLEFSFAESRC